MSTTHTAWHGYSTYATDYETEEMQADVSAHSPARYITRVNWPVTLAWGTVFCGGGTLWWLAALGLGWLTGWW
jgi:hypothetical protein